MEVSGRKDGEEDDSVADSQSFYELTCEPCNRDEGKHLKAAAYCLGCENYFCHACVKYHGRFGLKDHVLLEGDKMPKTNPPKTKETTVKKEDECTDRCDTLQNPEGLGKLTRNLDKHIQTPKASAKSNNPTANLIQSRWPCPKCRSVNQKVALACDHELCQDCARGQINQKRPCSDCGVITGGQPQGSMDTTDNHQAFIKMTFQFPDGIQMPHHPIPGQKYRGNTLVCFLHKNERQSIGKLLKIAFDRKLIGKVQDGTVCDNVGLFNMDTVVEGRYDERIEWREWFLEYYEWSHRITKRLADLGIHA